MRYPDTPFMKRTFNLMKNRGLNINLIDYIFTAPNTFQWYPIGPFGEVPEEHIEMGVENIVRGVLAPFKAFFKVQPIDIDKAMEVLMRVDAFSTRSYMSIGIHPLSKPYPSSTIHWCETMDGSTGRYDSALTEAVLQSLAFQWVDDDPSKLEWKCIE